MSGCLIDDVRIPMRDGVLLAADVYRAPDARVPAILLRTPYDRRLLPERVREIDPLLGVARGFAVVYQDVRGRNASGGSFRAGLPDGEDGVDTIAWLRAQPWCDGNVFMVGASYNGCVQLPVARLRPAGLVGLSPLVAGPLAMLWYPGGALRLSGVAGWYRALLAEALGGDALSAPERARVQELLAAPLVDCFHAWLEGDGVAGRLGEPLRHWIAPPGENPVYDELLAIPPRPLPAIHTSGWWDLCLPATVTAHAAWSAVGDPDAPQLLTLGPWEHDVRGVFPDVGLDAAHAQPSALAVERQLAFFEALLGRRSLEELPRVRSYVLGRNAWHDGDTWPPADARPLTLALDADADADADGGAGAGPHGTLGLEADGESTALRYRYDPRDPVPTHGGGGGAFGLTGPLEQARVERRADVLVFTSPRFDGELEVAGSPLARLLLDSDAPATDVIARLTIVDPAGRSFPVSEGVWSGRLAELPATGGGTGGARGARVCELALSPIHLALAPGWRLRLQVTSSCCPDIYPNPNTGHDLRDGPPPHVAVAQQTLLVGAGGSTLELPVRGVVPRGAGR